MHPTLSRTLEEAWRVAPRLSTARWAEEHRVLDERSAARPGPWRNEAAPHLVGIMDAFDDPSIREITVQKSSQGGGTEAVFNMLLAAASQRPGPALLVYPTRDLASDVLRTRLRPAFDLAGVSSSTGSDGDESDAGAGGTAFLISTARMNIWATGSNAEAALKSRPIRYAFIDELDACEEGADGLVVERLRTFPGSKMVRVSTPTAGDRGIAVAYARSDKRTYRCPCPDCGEYRELRFENLRWDGALRATPEVIAQTLVYACPACGSAIRPEHKPRMLARGVWCPEGMEVAKDGKLTGTAKGPPDHAGFRWSQLASPFVAWETIVQQWVEQHGDPDPNWVNQALGEPYVPRGERVEEHTIRKHFVRRFRGGYGFGEVPTWVRCLTAGVDLQRNELWTVVRGWSEKGLRSCLIYFDRRPCPYDQRASAMASFAGLCRETFDLGPSHPMALAYPAYAKHGMPIWYVAVDSGDGARTDEVYSWAMAINGGHVGGIRGTKVMPVKGEDRIGGSGGGGGGGGMVPYRFSSVNRVVRDAGGAGGGGAGSRQVDAEFLLVNTMHYKTLLTRRFRHAAVDEGMAAGVGAGGAGGNELGADGAWCWPDEEGHDYGHYVRHCTAEQLVPIRRGTRRTFRWELRPGATQNHLFDAEVYAIAVAEAAGVAAV